MRRRRQHHGSRRATAGTLAAAVLAALALFGHLCQGAHHAWHAHERVGGELVHEGAETHCSDCECQRDEAQVPAGRDGELRHSHRDDETCKVPPPDRVRSPLRSTFVPRFTPAPVRLAPMPRTAAHRLAVLAYAPKHSPPAAPGS